MRGTILWSGFPGTIEQLRGLACGAYFALESGTDTVDHLPMMESDRQVRKVIRRAWAISDATSAADTVELLALGMVTNDYDAILQRLAAAAPGGVRTALPMDHGALNAVSSTLADSDPARILTVARVAAHTRGRPPGFPASTSAWELAQAVELVRMCHRAGFVDDRWAWTAVIDLGRQAQERYADWTEFAAGFEWGRALASAEGAPDPVVAADGSCARTRPVITRLLTDPASPWLRVPLD